MYIRADHSQFEAAAGAIDSYRDFMKNKMKLANMEINILSVGWQGKDFEQFKSQWNKIESKGSIYNNMKEFLESYAKFLRHASKRYKETQQKAVERARAINSWW